MSAMRQGPIRYMPPPGYVFDRNYAGGLIRNLLKAGRIIRPETCSECGVSGRCRDGRALIQAHHPNYDRPFDIMWLCRRCHRRWHDTHEALGPFVNLARRFGRLPMPEDFPPINELTVTVLPIADVKR